MPKVADKKKGASYKKERPEGVIVCYQGYRFRIYPTAEQAAQFAKTFGCVRWVYNFYLSERNEVYKNTGKTLTFTDFNNAINQLKNHPYFNWLKEVDKFSLSNAILNVDTAFKNFFEGNAGFPRFKSKRKSKQSYTTNMTNANIKVDFDRKVIQLPKVGEVSFRCGKKVKAIKEPLKARPLHVTAADSIPFR